LFHGFVFFAQILNRDPTVNKRWQESASRRIRLVLTVILAAFVLGNTLHAQWLHNYDGDERALPLDTSKIAVQWREESQSKIAFEKYGIAINSMRPHAMRGWTTIDVPHSKQTQTAIRKLLAKIAKDPRVKFVTPMFFDPGGDPVFPTQDILVQFDPQFSMKRRAELMGRYGQLTESNWGGTPNTYSIRSKSPNGGVVLEASLELSRIRGINFAEPDFCFTVAKANHPNDPAFAAQWAVNIAQDVVDPTAPQQLLQRADSDLDLLEAFDLTRGESSIKIAVLDDGVQMDHPDLPIGIVGFDSTSDLGGGQPINQFDNHGTGIAGIIVALPNNGRGIAGAAPDAQLVSVRCYITTSNALTTMSSWTVNALKWCEVQNVRITNNSVLFSFLTNSVKNKYDSTAANGMLHFAAAGNTAGPTNQFPAKYNSVHGLMGLTSLEQKWIYSATGADMAYCGPAADIESTDRTGVQGLNASDYAPLSGTSYATAYASAIAGLVLSINPSLTSVQVHDIMRSTTRDLGITGFDSIYAAGFLNAYAAVFQAALTLVDPAKHLFYQAGLQTDDEFGASASALGDLDGDGILEFAVGAPLFDGAAGADVGQVRLFSGSKGILIDTLQGAAPGDQFGTTILPIPDMNGDNILDFAVASPEAKLGTLNSVGRITIYSGATRSPLYSINGNASGDRFGTSMATLSDIDGDSHDEFVVSSPGKKVNGIDGVGSIQVFSGKNGAPLYVTDGSSLSELDFGFTILRIKDQNSDDVDDILVGCPGAFGNGFDSGRIIAISGKTGMRLSFCDGLNPGDQSGFALATWIDQDNDGFREIIVSSPGFHGPAGPNSGLVSIHAGNIPGFPSLPLYFIGENSGDEFGTSLVDGLDIDGDGFEDLLIGAPGFDGSSTDIGKVYSYTSGGGSRARFELTGRVPFQRFGSAIAPLLNIDDDEAGEFVIGASGSSANSVPGFSVVICAPNPANLPFNNRGIMSGALGSEESGPYDVFFINSSAGGLDRTVSVMTFDEIQYTVQLPVANLTGKAQFSLHAYSGIPHPKWQVSLPSRMGNALWMPCTVSALSPVGYVLADSNPLPTCLPQFFPEHAPALIVDSVGFPTPTTITIFGLIEELPGAMPKVTNAIVLEVR
jgi:hypothetical protein